MSDKMREGFEKWARSELSYSDDDLHRVDGDSEYFWPATQALSKCWIASRAALVIELPEYHDAFESGDKAYWAEEVEAAITKAGAEYK